MRLGTWPRSSRTPDLLIRGTLASLATTPGAVDVSSWLRPEAATSPERLFCHVYGRGNGQAQMIPAGGTPSRRRWSRAVLLDLRLRVARTWPWAADISAWPSPQATTSQTQKTEVNDIIDKLNRE